MHRNRTLARALAALLSLPATALASPPTYAASPGLQQAGLQTAGLGPARATAPFSLLGLTWADPRAGVPGTAQVRTRSSATRTWSGWQTLEADGGGPGSRGATDPLWVGPSDGVEARVVGARAALPTGLRVDLINPDVPASSQVFARAAVARPRIASARATVALSTVALPTRPVPRMITRAGWGANESIVRAAPEYTGPVEVFFVHHTATGNGYNCAQSASIVRGIQAYQVRSRGWDDIGYNFLVDKCGTIFEGRDGGVGRSVLGAHTLGFNANASAIAAIGTYGAGGVPPVVKNAIAAVAAYKLGAYGNPPNGRVVLTSGGSDRYAVGQRVLLNRISGHRDTGRTDCPGDGLYAQLPSIRAIAGAAPAGLHLLRTAGATTYGSLLFTRGLIKPLWDLSTPSAMITRFEVRVDGRLTVAAPGSHRTTLLRLSPGGHTVTVRALHLSGRSTSVTTKVVADPTAPAFTRAPEVSLRAGSLNGTVPIRLDWTASDVNGVAAVHLIHPSPVALGTTTTSRNGTIAPARPTTFVLRATDRAGNAATASVTSTPMVVAETAATLTGTWRPLRGPGYLGGAALGSTVAGSSATWTFTGRGAALAVGRGAQSGQVRLWADGEDQGVLSLTSTRTLYKQAVWTRQWPTGTQHTVRVEVVTPGVVLDGLVYLK